MRLALLSLLVLAVPLAGCGLAPPAVRSNRTAVYAVHQDGTQSHGVLAATDVQPGDTGPQELFASQIPFGHFTAKLGVIWDGEPWVWNPLAPPAPLSAPAPCAPMTVKMKRTVQVPVTRMETREVEEDVPVVPVPKAAPNPCQPPPPVSSASVVPSLPDGEMECVDGACAVPGAAQRVAQGK